MKKIFRKVVKTFKKLGDSKLLTFGQNAVASVAAASDAFPAPTPTLIEIGGQLTTFNDLIQSSSSRDKGQIALKNQARAVLLLMLSQLCDYLNLVAQGDGALLAQTTFELNKVPAPIVIKAPEGLVVTDGSNRGELYLKCKSVPGASGYLFQYTTDPLLAEDSWVSVAATAAAYTFKGLSKGTTYYFRIIAVGAKLQSTASIVVNRVSQ